MKFLQLFTTSKKRKKHDMPDVAGMEIGAEKLAGLKPTDQFLISYPRSGNTWARYLLKDAIVLGKAPEDEEINPSQVIPDIHQSDLTHPAQIRFGMGARIYKSHNLRDVKSHRSVYLFRRAEDALLSYYHFGILRDQPWLESNETADAFCIRFLPTWKEHMRIAIEANTVAPDRMCFVAYENLLKDGPNELGRMAAFFNIEASTETLEQAVQRNTFSRLRAREEKRPRNGKGFFFRKGKAGSAKEELKRETFDYLSEASRAEYDTALRIAAGTA